MTIGQDDINARTKAFAENMRHRARDGKDGQVVKMDAAPIAERVEFLIRRLESIESRLTEMGARLEEVEGRPQVSEKTLRELMDGINTRFKSLVEKLVNAAMGDVKSRLVTVERTVEKGVPATNGGEGDKLNRLAQIVSSLGAYVNDIEGTVEARNEDLERRYAEMSEHMATVNDHIATINADALRMKTRMYRALKALDVDEDAA
jgi:uncharacterized coiled-coil protein SlyX